MRLALVKLIVTFLATLGFFVPHHRLLHCSAGHTPLSAPTSCEWVHV